MKAIVTDKKVVIVGLGKTGLSCVRYLVGLGKQVIVMDTRSTPPNQAELQEQFPSVLLISGKLDSELLCSADEIILSPGISLKTPEIQAALKAGVHVRGDIDLFVDAANAPIAAITGSNGKSTVTTLLGEMALKAGLTVGVGGNLGIPALDLLDESAELYVLELSSFQLETTHQLNAKSVVLLNLSEDHMDRYASKMEYLQAKQRIFRGARNVIVNDDESFSAPLVNEQMKLTHFGLERPDLGKYSVIDKEDGRWIVKGFTPLLPSRELGILGDHNISNALAALAMGDSLGIPLAAMIRALKDFKGLPHRCQLVQEKNGVRYVDDSKGTNPGSVVTALASLGKNITGKIVLIAGGDSKGADLSSLLEPVKSYAKAVVLIGVDAPKFIDLLADVIPVHHKQSLHEAVECAASLAKSGDLVLLSPACASFDMFKNYEHRGQEFKKEVMLL